MYAVEFQAPIKNGVVHIPKEYQYLENNQNVKFVMMYDDRYKEEKSIIEQQVTNYYNNNSTILDDNEYKLKKQKFMENLKDQYADT